MLTHHVWCMSTATECRPAPDQRTREDWTESWQCNDGSNPAKSPSSACSRRYSHMCRVCSHQLQQLWYDCPCLRRGRAVFRSTHLQSSCHISRFYSGTLLSGRMSQWTPSSCNCGPRAHQGTNGQSNVRNILYTSGFFPASHTMGSFTVTFYQNPYNDVFPYHEEKFRSQHTHYNTF